MMFKVPLTSFTSNYSSFTAFLRGLNYIIFNRRAVFLLTILAASTSVNAQWKWSVREPYVLQPTTGDASSLAAAEAQMRSACPDCGTLKQLYPFRYESDPKTKDPEYQDWAYSFGREQHVSFSGDSLDSVIDYLKTRYPSSATCPQPSAELSGGWTNIFSPPYQPSIGDEYCAGNVAYPGYPSNGTLYCSSGLKITSYSGDNCAGLERSFRPNRRRYTICEYTGHTWIGINTVLTFDDYRQAGCTVGVSGYITPPKSNNNCGATVGNPCVVSTGDKVQSATDFSSSTLDFSRFYNSRATSSKLSIGMGWRHSFGDQILMTHRTGTPEILFPRYISWSNGDFIELSRVSSSSDDFEPNFTEVKTSGIEVIKTVASEWHVYKKDGNRRIYDREGKLIRILTRQGQTTIMSYDNANRLISIVDNYGHAINLEYENELITKAIFPDGSAVVYKYDASKNMVSVIRADETSDTDDNPTLFYHYDDERFPHHLTGITDENEDRHATYAYDSDGKAISTEHAQTTNSTGQEKFELDYQGAN